MPRRYSLAIDIQHQCPTLALRGHRYAKNFTLSSKSTEKLYRLLRAVTIVASTIRITGRIEKTDGSITTMITASFIGRTMTLIITVMIDACRPGPCVWSFTSLMGITYPDGLTNLTSFLTTIRPPCTNVFAWRPFTWRARPWCGFRMRMKPVSSRRGMSFFRLCSLSLGHSTTTPWNPS